MSGLRALSFLVIISGITLGSDQLAQAKVHENPEVAVEKALKQGDKAPDFVLKNAKGNEVRLKELLKKGPVILVFYRGGWCPFCNMALKGFQNILPEIQEFGANLVAVSPEKPDKSLSTKEKANLEFEVLSDPQSRVAEAYGLAFKMSQATVKRGRYDQWLPSFNDDPRLVLPVPATYVISQDGTILWAFLEADYKLRADPQDVLEVLGQ